MTVDEQIESALDVLGVPHYPVVCREKQIPNSFVVWQHVTDDGAVYGGDACEGETIQMRLTWYDRSGVTGHKAALRAVLENAGYTYVSTNYGYDTGSGHYAVYVEGIIDA